MSKITMGNFFSGSGTWELAAKICGIDVLWESEIEPFPVALEAKRFPEAVQLGDISKVNGADIAPVDIMTNSSPCQDLSVAGKRAGLEGERSGLFNQVIRITKEMIANERKNGKNRDDIRPKYWCWENVPGALSSGEPKGEDFRRVLEEVAGLVEENPYIPMPPKGWSNAGVVNGERWQIAWRIMDSQFYGVPQRRRRIFLVLSTTDRSAGGVLFEQEGINWDFKKIAETWENTSLCLRERISLASRIVMDGLRSDEARMDERSITKETQNLEQ